MNGKSTMVATLGGQPQVITLMLDLLLAGNYPIENVFVTFPANNPRYREAFKKVSAEFVGDQYQGRVCHLRAIPIQIEGESIVELVKPQEIEIVRETLNDTFLELKEKRHTIHLGLSGGRRIISLVAISCAMLHLKPDDRIWHIFTPDEIVEKIKDGAMMHVPPESGVQLIEVPFVPWVSYFQGLETLLNRSSREVLNARFGLISDENRIRCQRVNAILTQREREVLFLLAEGLTRPEIAEKFHITVATFDSHRGAILQKCEQIWAADGLDFKEQYWQKFFGSFYHQQEQV
jgi:CRISPR-associated protein Csx14